MINSNEELIKSNIEYKKRFDNLPFAIILLDLDGKIKFLNKNLELLFNSDFDKYYEKKLISFPHFSDTLKKKISYIIEEVKKGFLFGPENINIEINEISKLTNIYASQIKIKNEFYIQIIIKELHEQNSFDITEQSILGILILQDDAIKYANNRFSELIGYDIEEVKIWKLSDLKKLFFKGHLSFILEQIEKKQNGIKDNINCFQVKYIRKSKQTFWVENIIQSIDYQDHPAALISVLDITKEKEVEELIIEENKRLRELDIIRKNFLDRASHELKTPLTSVYGASQLLRQILNDNNKNNEKYFKELVEIINEGSEKLTKLISNLLDISRLESTNLKLEIKKVDLINLINSCINDVKYLVKKRNHSITKELPKEFKMNIDKTRIERVITNLLTNAINYTPSGGLIKIKFNKFDDNIEISITDSGIGLSKEHLKRMFKKFVHIEKPQDEFDIKMNGTGLGLYISKEIIEMHKGKIYAESEGLNKGSTFRFFLPIN
ncbi:MAG: PAS domain S-box protein [Candidatus Lokiarchaeota archaeon]|nr:PAS domain S-box protein [Candidatus Lokiarchaeota archaeon]